MPTSTTPRKPPAPPTGTARYTLTSPRGGVPLATRTWSPSRRPVGIVLLVHGGGWHSGYFDQLALALTKKNRLFVASYDQAGCGYSDPDPAAPAGCNHVLAMDDLVDECYEAVEWALLEAGGDRSLPVFLVGESFGGIVVLMAAVQESNVVRNVNLKGVVGLGTLIRINEDMLPPQLAIRFLTYLAQYYPRLKMPATDFESSFDDAFGDKQWALAARKDPKVDISPQMTLGMAAAVLSSGDVVLKEASDFPVPFLGIHGARDCRTQCSAVQEFVDKVGPGKAELVVVDTGGHQLLQDTPETIAAVIEKVSQWLGTKL